MPTPQTQSYPYQNSYECDKSDVDSDYIAEINAKKSNSCEKRSLSNSSLKNLKLQEFEK